MKVHDDQYRYFEVYAKVRRNTVSHELNWTGVSVDVDERQKAIQSLRFYNEKLRNIAWMQSHEVRAPLARILGLVELLDETTANSEVVKYIVESSKELDEIIHKIVMSAEEEAGALGDRGEHL